MLVLAYVLESMNLFSPQNAHYLCEEMNPISCQWLQKIVVLVVLSVALSTAGNHLQSEQIFNVKIRSSVV